MKYPASIFFVILLSVIPSAWATDSLFNHLETDKWIDHKEANRLMQLLHEGGHTDSLYRFDANSRNDEMRLQLFTGMAYYYYDHARMSESEKTIRQAVRMAQSLRDSVMWSDNLALHTLVLQRLGRLEEGIATALQGLKVDSALQDTFRLSSTYNNLAGLCLSARKLTDAYHYINRAIALEESLANPTKLSIRYAMAAEIELQRNELLHALELAQKAYRLDSIAGKQPRMIKRQIVIGDICSAMKRWDDSERYYLQALKALGNSGDLTEQLICHKQLGGLYERTHRHTPAETHLKKAEELAQKLNNRYLLQLIYEKFHQLYRQSHPARSLAYLEQSTALKDSINTEKSERMLNEYKARYETAEKEATIQQQALQLQNRRQQLTLIAAGCGLALLLSLVLFFYFTRYRRLARSEQRENRQKEKLLSVLSHDIKNPLAMLMQQVRSLHLNIPANSLPELKQQSSQLLGAVNRQLLLVDNLLSWGRLQTRQWEYRPIATDLRSVIEETEKLLRPCLEEKACRLCKQYPPARIPVAETDRAMTLIVLRNLLQNAIKYSYPNGEITVKVEERDTDWSLTIVDQGVGLAGACTSYVPDTYFGQTTQGTAGESGTGTGLAVCRELLAICHGTLSISNNAHGKGVSACFTLPKVSQP